MNKKYKEQLTERLKKQRDNTVWDGMYTNVDQHLAQTQSIAFNRIKTHHNPYPVVDLKDLIDSIKQYGLFHNIVVKRVDDNDERTDFIIVSGHRRYDAIKHILATAKEGEYPHFEFLDCSVLPKGEAEAITNLKVHEANFQQRSLLKLPETAKLMIVEDYLKNLEIAKKQGLKLNGEEIKGTTRELLAKKFNISDGTAKKLISQVKQKNEVPTAEDEVVQPQHETRLKKLDKIYNQIKKVSLESEYTEAEIAKVKLIIEFLENTLDINKKEILN